MYAAAEALDIVVPVKYEHISYLSKEREGISEQSIKHSEESHHSYRVVAFNLFSRISCNI